MASRHGPRRLGSFGTAAIALELFLGIGAIAGGIALILGPRGEILPLPMSALAGSPFSTYLMPGLILFTVLGIGPFAAAFLAWRGHPLATIAAFGTGVALLIWILVEIAVIGYSNEPPLQPFYLGLAAVILAVAAGWLRNEGVPRVGPGRTRRGAIAP
jgi:hypothetical protein